MLLGRLPAIGGRRQPVGVLPGLDVALAGPAAWSPTILRCRVGITATGCGREEVREVEA